MTVTPTNQITNSNTAFSDAPVSNQTNASKGMTFAVPDKLFNRLSSMIIRSHTPAVQVETEAPVTLQGPAVTSPDGSWISQKLQVEDPIAGGTNNPSAPGAGNPAYPDRLQNGNAYRITTANQDNINQPPVIFINGINTSLSGARETAASLGELTGTNIDLVYNSSDPAVGAKVTLGHFHGEAIKNAEAEAAKGPRWSIRHGLEFPFMIRNRVYRETIASAAFGRDGGEWAKANALNNPPASQTTANLILDQLNSTDGMVNVVGYSQGGAIAADALQRVETHLVATEGREKANELLGRVRFLGLGAAAESDDFPGGITFNGIAHKGDVVPRYFGISRNGNKPGFSSILSALKPGNGFGVEQHVNYLDDQHGVGSEGDPLAEALVGIWIRGLNVGEQVIRDFED